MHAVITYTTFLAPLLTHAYVKPIKSSFYQPEEGKEERPSYTVLKAFNGYELRRYDTSIWTTALGSAGGWNWDSPFQKLFQYISGANENRQKIAMTAPVLSISNTVKQRQWFYLPKKHHNNPPKPTGNGVENVRWAPLDVYVITYNPPNNMNDWYKKQHESKLVQLMERDGFTFKDNMIAMHAGYNSPMARYFTSEVWITKDQVIGPEFDPVN